MAICGGVTAILAPSTMLALSKARMSTVKGQCFAFSDQGDGYLKGEGCGLVILKKLEEVRYMAHLVKFYRIAAAQKSASSVINTYC